VDVSHLQVIVIVQHAAWVDNRKTACFPFSFPPRVSFLPLGSQPEFLQRQQVGFENPNLFHIVAATKEIRAMLVSFLDSDYISYSDHKLCIGWFSYTINAARRSLPVVRVLQLRSDNTCGWCAEAIRLPKDLVLQLLS
jgi:hypothetical protein